MKLLLDTCVWSGAVFQQVLTQYGDELLQGAIITVEAGRVRIPPPEAKDT